MDDLEEIKKLKARYFRGLDSKDWDLYQDVFAEDVHVDLTVAGGEVYRGRDQFMAYARGLKLVQSVHQGHMPEIELTSPSTATGVWSFEDKPRGVVCYVMNSLGNNAISCVKVWMPQVAESQRQLSPHETQPEPKPALAPGRWIDERYQL